MENQKLPSLPKEWEEKYWLKYIGMDEPLLLTRKTRDAVLTAMADGAKYVQIKTYTIMVNSIQSIEPYYPPDNIPPRPQPEREWGGPTEKSLALKALWDEIYGGNKLIEGGV